MSFKITKDNTLLFTDLDGTLLDHNSYSFKDAQEMLDFIKNNKIPLIIVTSKTKPEILELQYRLDIQAPFIVENGAGIFIPSENGYEKIPLGFTYENVLKAFITYSKEFSMTGFSQMSNDEVATLTKLSLEEAIMAKSRDFTEPFILHDESKADELKQRALKDGLDVVKGGRFYHLITKNQDKATALLRMKAYYEKKYNKQFHTVALGDGENDISMLKSVDIPVLIPRYDFTYINLELEKLTKAQYPGPKGWNSTLKELFNV